MPTMTQAAPDVETRIDAVLEQERTAQNEQARAVVRARVIEQDRLAREAKEQAAVAAARAAYLARAEAAHPQACADHKAALNVFRATRLRLQALDTILGRQGFGGFSLGVELRHSCAAPDETDLNNDLGAAVAAMRKALADPNL